MKDWARGEKAAYNRESQMANNQETIKVLEQTILALEKLAARAIKLEQSVESSKERGYQRYLAETLKTSIRSLRQIVRRMKEREAGS